MSVVRDDDDDKDDDGGCDEVRGDILAKTVLEIRDTI